MLMSYWPYYWNLICWNLPVCVWRWFLGKGGFCFHRRIKIICACHETDFDKMVRCWEFLSYTISFWYFIIILFFLFFFMFTFFKYSIIYLTLVLSEKKAIKLFGLIQKFLLQDKVNLCLNKRVSIFTMWF